MTAASDLACFPVYTGTDDSKRMKQVVTRLNIFQHHQEDEKCRNP